MLTIKHAAERVGISTSTLRAWERRYGIVNPERSHGGYRLYGADDLLLLRRMAELVDAGWATSLAARHVLRHGANPAETSSGMSPWPAEPGAVSTGVEPAIDATPLNETFVEAAVARDAGALTAVIDEMFAAGSYEAIIDRSVFPALRALGERWAAGRLSVAGEHMASHAMMRRLGTAYEAAGTYGGAKRVLIGLAPGVRHELGLLAFAVAARRRGIATDYIGSDLPLADWMESASNPDVAGIVLALTTPDDTRASREVVDAVRERRPALAIAAGGKEQEQMPAHVVRLGQEIGSAAAILADHLDGRAPTMRDDRE